MCKCLPAKCDCNPLAEDPDSFCEGDNVCKDCVCQPQFPPGCDCDPFSADPSSVCPAGTECNDQCRCLPPGCDCDPSAEDPDAQCGEGFKCSACNCLPEKCDCNPLAEDPDSFCQGTDVCKVGESFADSTLTVFPGLCLPATVPRGL